MILKFPYGKGTVELDLSDEKVLSVIKSREVEPANDGVEEINRALSNPLEERRLRNLASKEKRVCIIVSDYTRAVPNYELSHLF